MRFIQITLCVIFSFDLLASGSAFYLKGQTFLNSGVLTKVSVIKEGDLIKTGAKSLALIKFNSGSTIKINENSEVKVSVLKPANNNTLLSLIKGSSFFKKDPKLSGKLNVKTKTATLGVRGTEFFVSYGKKLKDDVFMCVNEGSVFVTTDNKKGTIVKEGEGVNISSSKKISRPKFLPWTKDLNWSLNPKTKNLENDASIEEKYGDPLLQDYD